MGPQMKSLLLIAAGFALGVTAMLLFRRDATPSKRVEGRAEKPFATAPHAETDSPTRREEAASPAPPPPPPESPEASQPERVIVPDTSRTRYGRPPKPKSDDLAKATTSWDDFYRLCRDRGIRGELYEDLIHRRVAQELGLNSEKSDALKKLFHAEQEAATKLIVENAGGWANFERQNDDKGPAAQVRYDDWRRQRNIVRDSFTADYLKILSFDDLNYFSDHLRNTQIETSNSYSSEGDYHIIGGVGKPPPK